MHVPLFKAYWGNALIVFNTNKFTRVEPLLATQHPPTNTHVHSLPLSWPHPSRFLCKLISYFRGLLFLKEFLVASYTPIHHLSIAESRGQDTKNPHQFKKKTELIMCWCKAIKLCLPINQWLYEVFPNPCCDILYTIRCFTLWWLLPSWLVNDWAYGGLPLYSLITIPSPVTNEPVYQWNVVPKANRCFEVFPLALYCVQLSICQQINTLLFYA